MATGPIDYFNPSADDDRRRKIRWRILRIIIIVAVLVGVPCVMIATLIGVYVHRLDERLGKAGAHAIIIRSRIAGDPRFIEVQASEFTKHDGCLLINGCVVSQSDLDTLHRIVQSTSPPVYVDWRVELLTPEQVERFRKLHGVTTMPASQPTAEMPVR